MKKIDYLETLEFRKDLDRLCKKYRSLPDDIAVAKRAAIELFHIQKLSNQSIFPIPSFCRDEIMVYKLRKFACKSLKGKGSNSGIRLIYAFYPKTGTVEFLEIYFKGEKENENKDRIRSYLKERTRLKGKE